MHDAHVHLDFMANGEDVAADALSRNTLLFAATVTPADHARALKRFGRFSNVSVGWGMHPWWVAEDQLPVDNIPEGARFIGEVGLDFGKRHSDTRAAQLDVFTAIARACGEQGGKVLSVHSVHAAREVLDILDARAVLRTCECIFHWFTGPSDQLKRAIDAGCYFSVGPRMLATGKGREYVKAIPAKRLLLETDAPPGQDVEYSYAALRSELEKAAEGIAAIKGPESLAEIEATSARLFKLSVPRSGETETGYNALS